MPSIDGSAKTPFTGERCSCRPGIERDNCPACEGTGKRIDFAAIRAHVPAAAFPGLGDGSAADRERVRATLRRILPEGSTVWTATQHVTRSGRAFVLPQAFLAHEEKDPSTTAEFWSGAHIASRRYVLGREFAEALGCKWNREHMGWEGNVGEDAGGGIVARLGAFAWGEPTAYFHGRIS